MQRYDVIVVGGGHAGCEAAYVAVRRGCRTLLLAMDVGNIGAMSCNPAIGGVGKGHLVREVDAFAGVIGRAADAAAIHYRMLNRGKGPAVHGPRVQADRTRYASAVTALLSAEPNLTIAAGEVVDLARSTGSNDLCLTLRDGTALTCGSAILCTGTFLGGRLYRGKERFDGGRLGEAGAHPLADVVRGFGLVTRAFKTGTPPRLDGRTIDWARIARQDSDASPWAMSVWTSKRSKPTIFCGLTRTTAETHDVIRTAIATSPVYDGAITGRGPRYCPSIEDKVVRFGDRDGHQIFLEPETIDGALVYPNGISCALSVSAQEAFVRTIPGLTDCRIVTPGYAVEYISVDARQCDADLMVRAVPGLFLAGQINGTTGYEEAAAQGLAAGANAAAWAIGVAPVPFDRTTSYIGVLIDDLVHQEITEPYRMLTARAEHRLSLRADNAERRLLPAVVMSGVLNDGQRRDADARHARYVQCRDALDRGIEVDAGDDDRAAEAVADLLYRPYVERARRQASRLNDMQHSLRNVRFADVGGLSHEMIERLEMARPVTVSDAARIAGVTPAAVTALLAHTR